MIQLFNIRHKIYEGNSIFLNDKFWQGEVSLDRGIIYLNLNLNSTFSGWYQLVITADNTNRTSARYFVPRPLSHSMCN